jgi:hypothetical protein
MNDIDIQGLLTIDVASELRKLCQAQLQGPWQLPAELVRRAIRAGASRVEVRFSHHQVLITDDGPGLDPLVLEWTAALVDGRRPNQDRHAALATLERAGELAMLALAGADDRPGLAIDTVHGSHRYTLMFQAGAAPVLAREPATGAAGTTLSVRAGGLGRRRAARWLAGVARFAPVPVVVDGSPVTDGMADSLVQAPLAPPLQGRLALGARGDTARAYLLAHGLVTAHLAIPAAPCFEAAVELGTAESLDAARLREAVMPHLPVLVDQAVALVARASRQVPAGHEPTRARLAELTLQAARRGLRAEEIERAPVFRCFASGEVTLVDLAALRRSASADATLLALSPGQRPDSFVIGSEPVLIADAAEKSLLAEVLGTRFRTPNRRHSSHSAAATVRRLLHHAARALAGWADLLRHPRHRPALPDQALSPGEQRLLAGLRDQLRAAPGGPFAGAVLCEGRGAVRRGRGSPPILVLPRGNPTVMACVRASSADPSWMRLIHLALVGERSRSRT